MVDIWGIVPSGFVDYGVFSIGGRQVLWVEVSVISQIFILLEVLEGDKNFGCYNKVYF